MEITIKQSDKNLYPCSGILIESEDILHWALEIELMGLDLSSFPVYPLPGNKLNSLWGCLVVLSSASEEKIKSLDIGKNSFCQSIENKIFIPEKSLLYPKASSKEIQELCKNNLLVIHPAFGCTLISDTVDWKKLIVLPELEKLDQSVKPVEAIFIPKTIKSFYIKPASPSELLDSFEQKHFPQAEKFEDKSLNLLEKIKLTTLKNLFTKDKSIDKSYGEPEVSREEVETKETPLMQFIKNLSGNNKDENWANQLKEDYEELEKRNQKELDKLLEMFKKDPEAALKYAIPLDENNSSRGSNHGLLKLSSRWLSTSIFENFISSGQGNGSIVLPDNAYSSLSSQYYQAAQELIKQKKYEKAAFIYMKLLKNYYLAASTLEEGEFYIEAASIHEKFTQNKIKAAECFEKANMIPKAIEIYKELERNEKVGDLYLLLNDKTLSQKYYYKELNKYKNNKQYIKAALFCQQKINNLEEAQEILMTGWENNVDQINCLSKYFSNIQDLTTLKSEIKKVYLETNTSCKKNDLLCVFKNHYKDTKAKTLVKDLSYSLISELLEIDSSIISLLKDFEKNDRALVKDIIRYRKST